MQNIISCFSEMDPCMACVCVCDLFHLAMMVTGGVCLDTLCCIYYLLFRTHLSGAFQTTENLMMQWSSVFFTPL